MRLAPGSAGTVRGPGFGVVSAGHAGETMDLIGYLSSILISLLVGLAGFVLAYKIFDWLTPGVRFAEQLNADNRSVAIFLAGLFVGLGVLLGSAVK